VRQEDGVAVDPEDIEARLAAVRAKRGYLLPHHGLLALTAPALLEAYDAAYAALALEPRLLSAHDREFVWLAILAATDEALATHHVAKFRAAGGSPEAVAAAVGLTALASGASAYLFAERHWRAHMPEIDPRAAYLAALRGLATGTPLRLVHLAASAVHACRGFWEGLRWQIVAAYQDGVPEAELAEALSLVMFPGSVPRFVEAAAVWRSLIAADAVAASPAFRLWAGLSGQGGWDEATSGKKEER
jgi:alkylhydroperoxidase/carboxymuconolactone decarboxylase family protein YurZ